MKYVYLLLLLFIIICITIKIVHIDKLNNIIPTFHILIATNGRPSMIKLLNSLRDQLNENDAVTIVFDGPDAYNRSEYNDSWISDFKSKVNIIIQEKNTGFWGHPIRQKHVSILNPKTTFIMNADDDDYYLPDSFDKLRKKCIDPNTLYIAKMDYLNNLDLVIPKQNEKIINSDIGNPNGIIPFDMASYGTWGHTYTGDFDYYNTLQNHVKNIVFLDDIIYRVNHIDPFYNINIIYVFWTGNNPMSENRKNSLKSLKIISESNIMLITPSNLNNYIKENAPLHPAYDYLSLTHKSDYLRCYFMYHYGGGYSDVKKPLGSWKKGFELINLNNNIWMIGTREKDPIDVGYVEDPIIYENLQKNYKQLPQNCAYICKPNTPLFKDVLNDIHKILDIHYEKLKTNNNWPIRAQKGDGSGYPIGWTEILGSLIHQYALKYNDHILFEGLPGFDTSNYQ
jgi:hypothetical protein